MAGMTKPRRSGAGPRCGYGRLTYRSSAWLKGLPPRAFHLSGPGGIRWTTGSRPATTSVGMSEQWGTP